MAIALDNSADLGIGSPGLTTAYTNNGTVLIVVVVGDVGSDNVSGVTYNGTSMTLLDKDNTGNRCSYSFILKNPSTGSHNVVVSASGSFTAAGAISYTGADTTTQPDAHNESNQGVTLTATTSLTTVADNCWVILASTGYNGQTLSAGTGSTLRVQDNTFSTWGLFDSNGPITPAQSYSMSAVRQFPNGNAMLEFMISIQPTASGDKTVAATGSSITATVGSVTESGGAIVASTGSSLALTVGSVSVGAGITVNATGNSLALTVGSVTESAGATVAATGSSIAASVGDVSLTGDAVVDSTGTVLNITAGMVNVSAGGSISVNVTGVVLHISVGDVTVQTSSGGQGVNYLGFPGPQNYVTQSIGTGIHNP